MASYISVPRDLTRVRTKILFGLTKRQLICFSIAAAIGVPVFFGLRRISDISFATMGMMIVMMPLFLLAMYERDGMPLEVIARHFIEAVFIRPQIRPYRTDNYYEILMRQHQAEMEVDKIVLQAKTNKRQHKTSRKSNKGREKGSKEHRRPRKAR